jgi:hypothetical protein
MAKNSPIAFDITALRSTAQTITTTANDAAQNHQAAWQRLQNHVNEYPFNIGQPLLDLLHPHLHRMSQTFDWQQTFASRLDEIATLAEETDQEIARWFQ